MRTLGAHLSRLEPGEVGIAFGLAAYTLMPADADVLSVEFKVNLLRPAVGERFLACGRVIKPGSTLVVTQGELRTWPRTDTDGDGQPIAIMQATMIRRQAVPAPNRE